MKIIGILAVVALGCSAADETMLDVPQTSETLREPGDAKIVDPYETVEWSGGVVEFYDASSEEGPSVVISRMGYERDGDIVTRLQEQVDFSLSAAEIWRALTGRTDVPDLLARTHLAQVAESGRPAEYAELDVDAPVDKAGFSFAAMFPLPAISGNRCWENISLHRINVGDVLAPTLDEAYTCSSGNPIGDPRFVRRGTVSFSNACPTSFNSRRYVRAGTLNDTAGRETAQACFGSGSGAWQCSRVFDFPTGAYFAQEMPDDGSNHRLAVSAIGLTGVPNGPNQFYGAALLNKTRVPAFGSTSCVQLVQGPTLISVP